MWKLFCIAGTLEFHTPPTAHRLPSPCKAHKKCLRTWESLCLVPAGVGLCRQGEPSSLLPSGKVTRAETKGLPRFGGGCELQQG